MSGRGADAETTGAAPLAARGRHTVTPTPPTVRGWPARAMRGHTQAWPKVARTTRCAPRSANTTSNPDVVPLAAAGTAECRSRRPTMAARRLFEAGPEHRPVRHQRRGLIAGQRWPPAASAAGRLNRARLAHRRAAPLADPSRHGQTPARFVTLSGNETSLPHAGPGPCRPSRARRTCRRQHQQRDPNRGHGRPRPRRGSRQPSPRPSPSFSAPYAFILVSASYLPGIAPSFPTWKVYTKPRGSQCQTEDRCTGSRVPYA
jgi:hypothetical protein